MPEDDYSFMFGFLALMAAIWGIHVGACLRTDPNAPTVAAVYRGAR